MKATVVIREPGKLEPDYSLDFELPSLPSVGDYLSIHRADAAARYSEDVIVRKVWWHLDHPETGGSTSDPKTGSVFGVHVECDVALGPYATDRWRDAAKRLEERGVTVEKFDVRRFSVREGDLGKP